ncbi:hypothetical protein [Pelagovum pacificum]|uniref:Capsular biosynthesis protein n=1 Tax=Pelagovum pacificum TaxID=2588711 RepID=A0A5C5GJX4_9RHOB|nr:hypothetical protein [Pelagovum pacificum]QQA42763.1 hypothetical protein I8N54_18645 [Pelagovum pacificum]TNY34089.1 hypothetical protein FHY64_12745 [Pelagovum pacificum]
MSVPRVVNFYLEDGLKRSATGRRHNFISKLVGVLEDADYDVVINDDSDVEVARSLSREGYSMFHMTRPTTERGLTFRRVYQYPFWQIEKTPARWNWHVAKSNVDWSIVPEAEARRFHGYWRDRLFPDVSQDIGRDGFVYVPLQGKLTERRSFQACSPVDMVRSVLTQDPDREVLVTLHPDETYSDAELAALHAIKDRRLTIETGMMDIALSRCDYVVTQNSAAAFNGFLFEKPAVLFAKIDFHHIAANVLDLGETAAFEAVKVAEPDYAGFVWWFWQHMSINAGRPHAEQSIRTRLLENGWPL